MDTADAQTALQFWVVQQLQGPGEQKFSTAETGVVLQPLGGDAGFRCYSRVNSAPSTLAVHAPVNTENSEAFVAIANCLRRQGIDAPEIHAVNFEQGFLLLEDLGEQLLSEVLSSQNVDHLYSSAMQVLLRLQACREWRLPVAAGHEDYWLPDYDRGRLHDEMLLLQQWFIPELLGLPISTGEQKLLDAVYRALEDMALRQPQVWVHRDFHSRNLIFREGKAPGVIDFQDAVRGPLTYDLVSLLRDCYVRWPPARVYKWMRQYFDAAVRAGLLDASTSAEEFERWFDWMGLQRHIKVLGIFARLWLRDGKSRYLQDLPLVMRYTLEVADKYETFRDFSAYLRERLLPHCMAQGWYRDIASAGDTP